MLHPAIADLCHLPYLVAEADTILADVYCSLLAASPHLFCAAGAATNIHRARHMLSLVVRGIDPAVTRAIQIAEEVEGEEEREEAPW